ncbi:MAG: hypothetical protein U0903_13185 [Planctomycetales bacterium]
MFVNAFVMCVAAVISAPAEAGPPVALRYTGSLTATGRESNGQVQKRFSVFVFLRPQAGGGETLSYVLEERGSGEWAWPERFGRMTFDPQTQMTEGKPWKLLQDHKGVPQVVKILGPIFTAPEALKEGGTWQQGNETAMVTAGGQKRERDCWQIQVKTPLGPKRTVWREKNSPLIVEGEERIFLGQGEEHTLKWQLESQQAVSAVDVERWSKLQETLFKLQQDLQRGEDNHRGELTEKQLDRTALAVSEIGETAVGTPFSQLVSSIRRDLKSQQQRGDELFQLAKKMVGSPAPPLKLRLIDQSEAQPIDYKGKITVLHFWDYKLEPLVEPYGQVGYLDFLYSKRHKLGVQIYGVALDTRAEKPETRAAADRAVGKLKDFMNLAYPLAVESPGLIQEFGDPRKAGGRLPLWVVIGPDGKYAFYRTGFFQLKPDEGLKELDDVLVKMIQEMHAVEKK